MEQMNNNSNHSNNNNSSNTTSFMEEQEQEQENIEVVDGDDQDGEPFNGGLFAASPSNSQQLSCSTTPNSSMNSGLNGSSSFSAAAPTATRPKYAAKLRSASRAIGLFRRAAGTLSRSLTIGQMNKSASSSTDLNAATSDHQSQDQAGTRAAKRRRSSTFRRFIMRHQSTGNSSQYSRSSSQNLQQSSSTNGGGGGGPGSVLSMGDSSQQAFIVPRMNALKLPLKCLIRSLDGELMREIFVHRYELGQFLIENLKVSLGMNDCKYFGLRLAKSCDDQEDVKNIWLDLNESVCKQIKNNKSCSALLATPSAPPPPPPTSSSSATNDNGSGSGSAKTNGLITASSSRAIEFYLRIKFYPPNLARIQDSFLRNYLWLQLRRDLRLGKLTSSMNNLAQLMACILQYEFGDFKQEHLERLPEMNVLPNQDLVEDAAIEMWRTKLANFKRHQAQMQFLRAAIILETYGFDYYPVRDHQRQRAYLLGFNYAGVKTIRNGRIVHHFRWHSISKISYERRMIIFHIYPTENSKRKQILGFKCMSNDYCQNLYMRLLEQKYFFTVDLAYFDKSIRRPSCLYTSPDGAGSSQGASDWTSNNSFEDQHRPQLQRQQTFGNRPSTIHQPSGSLEDPPTTSVSSTPECGAPYECSDCCNYQQEGELVRSTTTPYDMSGFDNGQPMVAEQPTAGPTQTWQRRAAMARLHRQQSTSAAVSFGEARPESRGEDHRVAASLLQQSQQSQQSSEVQQPTQEPPKRSTASPFQSIFRQLVSDSDQNYLIPILKLILVILVTNLALRLTDSLSCALITLLTFSSASQVDELQAAASLTG